MLSTTCCTGLGRQNPRFSPHQEQPHHVHICQHQCTPQADDEEQQQRQQASHPAKSCHASEDGRPSTPAPAHAPHIYQIHSSTQMHLNTTCTAAQQAGSKANQLEVLPPTYDGCDDVTSCSNPVACMRVSQAQVCHLTLLHVARQ